MFGAAVCSGFCVLLQLVMIPTSAWFTLMVIATTMMRTTKMAFLDILGKLCLIAVNMTDGVGVAFTVFPGSVRRHGLFGAVGVFDAKIKDKSGKIVYPHPQHRPSPHPVCTHRREGADSLCTCTHQ